MDEDQREHASFEKPFAAAMLGGWLGSVLARTRFGQWFENSTAVGWILSLIIFSIMAYATYVTIVFIGILINTFIVVG